MDERTVAEHWVLKFKLDKKGIGGEEGQDYANPNKECMKEPQKTQMQAH